MGKTPCVWKKMANRNGPNSFYKFNVILNEIRLFFYGEEWLRLYKMFWFMGKTVSKYNQSYFFK